MPARVIAQHQNDRIDDKLQALFLDAIIWIIEHISNQWLVRAEAPELQMKQEEFIYLRISNKWLG